MRLSPFAFLLAAAAGLAAPAGPLRVLRVSPSETALPTEQIAVTFDRPVAGSLDYSVDPQAIFRIEPAAPGKVEWRDPVTLTFTPAAPLRGGARYTVTVANTFRAMDGSRLEEPYRFTVRVSGPRLLTGAPPHEGLHPRHLPADTRFELVWSAPVDLTKLAAAAYLEFDQPCRGAGVVRLRPVTQRRVAKDDNWRYHEAGGWQRDRRADSLRRVAVLAPAAPLPLGCTGAVVAPAELAEDNPAGRVRWPFSTYGPFQLTGASCPGQGRFCPTGPVVVTFNTPVRGAEVMRRVKLFPAAPFTVRDTLAAADQWQLMAELKPRTTYAVVADTGMRDIFGQRLVGNPAAGFATTGHEPSVSYPYGRLLVEAKGFGTLAIQHVNVDTLHVTVAPVPDSLESQFLRRAQWGWGDLWQKVRAGARVYRVPVRNVQDKPTVTGVKLALPGLGRATLYAVHADDGRAPEGDRRHGQPRIALVQVTDLAVHAKLGAESGVVWVTGVHDGRPRAGAAVVARDHAGRVIARGTTDAQGLVTFPAFGGTRPERDAEDDGGFGAAEGYVAVTLGGDRAVVGISQYDPDLSPWNFGVSSAWGSERIPAAGAVFTERGIYRPGEPLYAKAVIRRGALGALGAAAGDSLRWQFKDRDQGVLKDTTVALSAFGTASYVLRLPAAAPLGLYSVAVQTKRRGRWTELAGTSYRVAEYRPPEFLVDLVADSTPRFPGDSVRAAVQARYLFGAPMAHAPLTWQARQTPLSRWELDIPNTEGYYLGENASWWWEERGEAGPDVTSSGVDTLDAAGHRELRVALPPPAKARAARVTIAATVTDVNRQAVGASTSLTIHPAAFYLAAKPRGEQYFWQAGKRVSVEVLAVRPDGRRVPGVAVRGAVVRREWHQVHRERRGVAETVGEWVSDTVARCALTTAAEPAACEVTPAAGGVYVVTLSATDGAGREAVTSFIRWAAGKDWVPWYDASRFKMDVIADRERYSVGDTATVLLASPFTDVEAWVTVEREGIIEQRRMRLTAGSTTLKLPITEAYVPNAYVSVLVTRGRSEPPGTLDDPGRPTMRVGYAELRVTPEVKRLAVAVEPLAPEYRPGDTARVRLRVADARGAGQRAEVTLWAVDEGVLALTGYKTPDPIDLIYRPRGLGLRLASTLSSVAPQIPEGEKGKRAPGGGGGADGADILRSRFATTAFFLGSVVTDADGRAVAAAKLPDNLTTFRVMAVAVTAGDRYGSGQSSLLVTRPLVARPALPRFVRPGDEFLAGTVVNRRAGGAAAMRVEATATGVELRGRREQRVPLQTGRGAEVRFGFRAPATSLSGDSVTFRFRATAGAAAGDADAVQARLAVRPDHHPRAYTMSGVLRDTAAVEFLLPDGIDPARSRLELAVGSSPLTIVRGAHEFFRVYPYYCTEQVISSATPLIALLRAQQAGGAVRVEGTLQQDVRLAVDMLTARQRADGGIGYWSADDWSTPWLSAYAGAVLLDARAAGVAVSDSALARLGEYLARELREATPTFVPVMHWYDRRWVGLAEQVAVVDLLSRLGRPDVAAEHRLLAVAPQMALEDRARLAEVLARRQQMRAARQLLAPAWALAKVEGRRAVLPDSVRRDHYFRSRVRPAARLLTATLAVDPAHPLVGPLVETLVHQGRAEPWWNTQDWGAAVSALAEFERRQRAVGRGAVRVRAGTRVLFEAGGTRAAGDSSVALTGLLGRAAGGVRPLRLALDGPAGGAPAYYYLTVREVPLARPVTPVDAGIQVERWYERYDRKAPVTSVAEGELVRVRLRITVPADRQFVVLDDPLPAGLEAVDLSLRTAAALPGPGTVTRTDGGRGHEGEDAEREDARGDPDESFRWAYGSWDSGWWSPFDHREIRDDRVVYSASVLWKGTYTATYVARATTPGVFVRPPAHAEEMYNPAVHGRSDGGVFTVREK